MERPDETAPEINGSWPVRLRILLAAHVALTVIATGATMVWSGDSYGTILFVSVLMGQSCLLGSWLALGETIFWVRSIVVFLLATCLGAPIVIIMVHEGGAFTNWTDFIAVPLIYVATPIFGSTATLLVVRLRKARLQLLTAHNQAAVSEGLQFSVRDLFLLMALVAVLLKTGQVVRGFRGGAADSLYTMIVMGLFSLCLVVPALAMVWATLGRWQPYRRMAIAIVLSLFSGLTAAYFMDASWERGSRMSWMILATAMTIATIVGCSLLVIRSLGYRLVRVTSCHR